MNLEKSRKFEARTEKFGIDIVKFCKKLKNDNVSAPIINQLVRSGTSIGANYLEANNASSKKDFTNKIYICKKESQETKYWLKIIENLFPESKEITNLTNECFQLVLIFQKIISTLKNDK